MISMGRVLATATLSLFVFSNFAMAKPNSQLACAFVGPIQGVFLNQHINYNTSKKKKRLREERSTLEKIHHPVQLDGQLPAHPSGLQFLYRKPVVFGMSLTFSHGCRKTAML